MQESLRQPVTHLVIDLVRGAQQQNVDDSRAALTSWTTITPCWEPGGICVSPTPIAIEHADPRRSALAIASTGLAGLTELSFELEPERRGAGRGAALIRDALSAIPAGRLVVAAIAPGNAASLRAALAAGFSPGIAARLMAPMAPGSYLVMSHPASDVNAEVVAESARQYNQSVATAQTRRSHAEVMRFLDGMDAVEPGVVQCHRWHPQPGAAAEEYEVSCWAGIGLKL